LATPSNSTISNSSCLIALEVTAHLDLLRLLYQAVLIPPAVAAEWGMAIPPWLKVQSIGNQPLAQALRLQLGPGEAEAITLAVETGASRLILDDRRARRVANNLHVPITGTVGVVLRAKQRGFIPLVRPVLDAMRLAGFRLSDLLYQQALQLAGE
jgi:predicted nucleic acid-binding protein